MLGDGGLRHPERTRELRDGEVASLEKLGALIAERLKAKNVTAVVFDRNGYRYHGKVKAVAEGARKAGIRF